MRTKVKTKIRTKVVISVLLTVVIFGGLYSIGHLSYSSIPFIRSKVDLFRGRREVNKLNKYLSGSKLEWKASMTNLSTMNPDQFSKYFGSVDLSTGENIDFYDEIYKNNFGNDMRTPYSKKHTWDNVEGINYMSPVRDQQGCGSCWAHTAVGVTEGQLNIDIDNQSNLLEQDIDNKFNLSEQELVSCSDAGTCSGGSIRRAFSYINIFGLLKEDCFKYKANDLLCDPVCYTRYYIHDWFHIPESYTDSEMVGQIKKIIYNNGPTSLAIKVFPSYRHYDSGVYQHIDGENVVSNHGVVLLGYNDDLRAFRIKDSHGTDWGEDGYAWISYDECCGDEVDGDLEKKAMVKKSIYGVLTK